VNVAEVIEGARTDVLLLCDHASNVVPKDIDLAIAPELLGLHIAVDIGAEPLTRSLAAALDAPAILARVSRLVIDLHREPDHPALIPVESDGHAVPGNQGVDRAARIARFHAPYHRLVAEQISMRRPEVILSIHSFTPRLEQGGSDRPWEVGVLYNRDTRAAAHAVRHLREAGLVTGDNEPYSGRLLNDAAGVARWTELLLDLTNSLRNHLACGAGAAQ
jgi:predicted N-formylglutamate amidohydrolase